MAETQYSLRLVKRFTYRGNAAAEFSNRYYFDGGSPGDHDAWMTLFDAIILVEKTCYPNMAQVVQAYGYEPGSDIAVASANYAVDGTLAVTGGAYAPGDAAAVLRMATTKKSTTNHTVYVFTYMHAVLSQITGSYGDTLLGAQKTALENFGTDWINGITVAGRAYKRTTPDGHLVTGRAVNPYIGHRDFPR